jgi:hypothetical protein
MNQIAIDTMSQELCNNARARKSSLWDVVPDFSMLKYMVGMTVEEFTQVFHLALGRLKLAFPKTPKKDAPEGRLSLRLIFFLALHRLRHMLSLRHIQGFVGFSCSHLCTVLNRVEDVLHEALKTYLAMPTMEDLQ